MAPDATTDRDELLRKADVAFYEAKRRGRGRYQLFVDDMDDILRWRRVVRPTSGALAKGDEFKLFTAEAEPAAVSTFVSACLQAACQRAISRQGLEQHRPQRLHGGAP